ncbi:MAG: mandelate racemase/muconate lactonizing enzyme family protein [Chloroflexota bacterium]|nr:MAG: mandelate racemase/muconate lactonizing enzyme family protein [Chloroflexota bacterium]
MSTRDRVRSNTTPVWSRRTTSILRVVGTTAWLRSSGSSWSRTGSSRQADRARSILPAMKITDITCIPSWNGHRNDTYVFVDTDAGITGIGEGGLTGQELAMAACIEHLEPRLIGRDPFEIERLWQLLFRGGFFPAAKIGAAAISAIDIALWDIKGKALGVPVYELLGGKVRDRVVVYPHNRSGEAAAGRGQIDELVASCLETWRAGWKFVRWGLPQQGDGVLEGAPAVRMCVEQVRAVRDALGPEAEICVDVHTRLDQTDTIQLLRAVEPYRPYFMEDPIRAENLTSLRRVRQVTAVPIAMGEHASSKWELKDLIEEELADYVRVDVTMCGGLSEARKIAGWAETHYLKIAPHSPNGPVVSAASLHLCLATDNFGVLECPRRPGTHLADAFPVQLEWEDGYLLPPSRPGLGVSVDRDVLRTRYPYRPTPMPSLHRRDGSLTNW